MRRLGGWLGIVAIALQIAWPVLASAKPKSAALVPLCTVDGVTHYLEVPIGKAPLDESSSRGGHCPLCFLGLGAALLGHRPPAAALPAGAAASVAPLPFFSPKSIVFDRGARAPPSFFRVLASDHEPLWRRNETALPAGRATAGALERSRLLRLGLLHDQH